MGRKDTYLTEKYKRLYGAMDCSEEVNKARREMRLKYAAVCILFALLIGAGQASQNSMEKELIKNAQGALISVNRPESGAQPLIFTADAAVKTKEGIVEKQVQVTIEPYNSGKEKRSGRRCLQA